MKSFRIGIFVLAVAACTLAAGAQSHAAKSNKGTPAAARTAGGSDNKFHLKPDAREKVCLTCHADFEDKLKKAFVHTPVRKAGCPSCHNPHTSHYPKQLAADTASLCVTCHKQILPQGAESTHKAALEGKCILCHDPHSSDNKFNLRSSGNELCYSCHKDKAEAISKAKYKHNPVEKACVNCHNPHASMKASALLKENVPGLCKKCHQTDNPMFVKQHMNYPVADSRCTLCHNAHGSDRPGMIYNAAHPPFANKTCNLCHENSGTQKGVTLKKKGFELCRGCHNNQVNEMFAKNRLHWPVVGKSGCLNCHSPHASPEKGLLKEKTVKLCGTCHADTIRRQETSGTKHKPVLEGACTSCHNPHAGDYPLLLLQKSSIDVCGKCHDWQKHSTHPVGEKITDKRNKNLSVQCLSCHRSHGTAYKRLLPFPSISELCTQCHVEKAR